MIILETIQCVIGAGVLIVFVAAVAGRQPYRTWVGSYLGCLGVTIAGVALMLALAVVFS